MTSALAWHTVGLATLVTLALSLASVRAAEQAATDIPLRSLDPPVLLPNGREFKTWEAPGEFSRTYYVDQAAPGAADSNPGTKEKPFLTIGRAAELLQPGERVVVAAGVYRERIKPARGGTGPTKMISYEAAPGASAVIKGSRVFTEKWEPSKREGQPASAKVWAAPLAKKYFGDYNPFDIDNVTGEQFDFMDWAQPLRGKLPYTLPRGMIFQDGRRLEQAAEYAALAGREGTFWVDRPAQVIHVHPFGEAPNGKLFEITTERIAFGPEQAGLGFIGVRGFTVEQVGNAFPMQQEGAISTWRGHHWIIESNTVRWANGVGIDVGIQHPRWPRPDVIGHHIVRGNTVTDVGVCGIAGIGSGGDFGLLIESNTIRRAAYHDAERLWETGGIKTHINTNCLIRANLIAGTLHGPGIWMDWANANSRCTRNVILDTHTQFNGGIFIEASPRPNLIDSNFIWGSTADGIYEHDSANQTFAHNFIGRAAGAAVLLNGKITDRRIYGQPIADGSHRVAGNVFFENGKNQVVEKSKSQKSAVEANLGENITAACDMEKCELEWSVKGALPPCPALPALTHDFFNRPRQGGAAKPGPFGDVPTAPTRVKLWPVLAP